MIVWQAAALRAFSEEQGVSADVLRQNITKLYAERGVTLDQDGANRELTAAYCENRLFKDENSIQRLAQTDVSLFQRIRQWLSDLVIRLRGTEEQKRVLEVQRLYEKAARNVGAVQDRGAQYQIRQDTEGDDFVQVDEDILNGKTEKEHAAILSDIIQNKFGNIIEASGQTFGVNSTTNGEWRWSNDARKLYKRDHTAYMDKIRAFNNADELMQASTDYVGEAPKHERKDNFREFARGKVNYKVGENGYTADVVVGITRSGKAYLYDIVNIEGNKITEPPLLAAMMNGSSKPLAGDSVDNSIAPDGANGNTSVQNTFGFTPEQIAEAANRQAGLLGNYEMYGKSVDQAMRELQNKLTEKRSFLYDDDSKQVRAVQSAALRETWEQARPVHEQIEKFQKNHPLSTKDEQLLQAALVNDATDTFGRCDDPAAVMHRYQLQQELNRRMQPIRDYQRARGETMALNAEEMADTIAEFAKDKKIPGAYSRETMERNSYDIFGKKNRAYAERLNDDYFTPVHKAVADRTNYVNTMRQ